MKKVLNVMLFLFICVSLFSMPAFAKDISNYELMQELKSMKARIETLVAVIYSRYSRV